MSSEEKTTDELLAELSMHPKVDRIEFSEGATGRPCLRVYMGKGKFVRVLMKPPRDALLAALKYIEANQ